MIKEFVEAWEYHKVQVERVFSQKHPDSYEDIVSTVINILPMDYKPKLTTLSTGDYQGTLCFVIHGAYDFWYVKVDYGSCSGCDTLQAIRDSYFDYDSPVLKPNAKQVKDYMALALHIVQGLKVME